MKGFRNISIGFEFRYGYNFHCGFVAEIQLLFSFIHKSKVDNKNMYENENFFNIQFFLFSISKRNYNILNFLRLYQIRDKESHIKIE